ncbi:MAG: transglycosylase SLT domain-containing protein [Thermoanaerobaculaceae bacterium]|nr:transglycosylase SLT domain-containing protein [Thermoanaerobaculaceae bacterium]
METSYLKTFALLICFGALLVSCAVQQEQKIYPVVQQTSPKVNRGQELADKIMSICDSLSNSEISDDEKKGLYSEGENALNEYFMLEEEEMKEPRLQGAVERFLAISLKNALKVNEAPTKKEEEESPKDELLNMTTFLSADELLETLKEVEKAKENISLGIPIPLDNETVLSYVRLYESKLKNWFSASLERGYPYLDEIKAVFKDENVPPELVYLGIVESAFKINARSRAGALGMWQFMEGTAKKYELKIDFWEDERLDPIKSARASAKYLNFLYSTFQDWHLAIASYNCGEGKILRYKSTHPKGDFWSLRKTRFIRKETKEYVPAILAAIIVASQPESFGIKISSSYKERDFASIAIDFQVDLRELARFLDVPVETLLFLNPSLKRVLTPPGKYELKVPANLYEKAENYLKTKKDLRVEYVIHTVRKGETIRTIARKYKIEPSEISAVNIGLPARLRPKTQILIIRNGENHFSKESAVSLNNQSKSDIGEEKKVSQTYIVKKGDTLAKIARDNGTTVESLCRSNKITTKTTLKIGMKLVIPSD